MTLEEFTAVVDVELVLYTRGDGRWICRFKDSEIKQGSILASTYGSGSTPYEAMDDYAAALRTAAVKGYSIVFNATNKDSRREFGIPHTITAHRYGDESHA